MLSYQYIRDSRAKVAGETGFQRSAISFQPKTKLISGAAPLLSYKCSLLIHSLLLFIACYVYSRVMLTNHFTLTKRLLGLLLLIVGIVGFVAVLSVDILDVGREGGIGPAQRIALGGAALIALIGLTLIPIRDQLA